LPQKSWECGQRSDEFWVKNYRVSRVEAGVRSTPPLVPTIAAVAFGVFIALTSAGGIVLGLRAGEGWLAILYGALGVSMGVAGIVGVRKTGAVGRALLGWFFIGIASRAIVEGDAYLFFISAPVALVLLAGLAIELLRKPSVAGFVSAAAGGGLAILSLVALAVVAPALPPICQPLSQNTFGFVFLYPGNTPPFDAAESKYDQFCLSQTPPQQ
jgi:hypothetical protein